MNTLKEKLKAGFKIAKARIGLKVICGLLCLSLFSNALSNLIKYFELSQWYYIIASMPLLILFVWISNRYLLKPMPRRYSHRSVMVAQKPHEL